MASVEEEVNEKITKFMADLDRDYKQLPVKQFKEEVLETVKMVVEERIQVVEEELGDDDRDEEDDTDPDAG